MEIIGAHDDFGFAFGNAFDRVTPLTSSLDGSLHRLGAGIHGQGHIEAGEIVEFLIEQRELIVAEGTRGERDLVGLVSQSFEDLGMAMSLIHG